MNKKTKQKQERARDIFLRWCDPKRKDKFICSYSDKVFVAERIPQDFIFKMKYNKKKK